MTLVLVTAPTDTPVSLDEAKEQIRLSSTTHDDLITRLIKAATSSIETETGARLAGQTLQLQIDCFPVAKVDLCVYPVTDVTEVKYDDDDGVEQTLSAGTDFWVRLSGKYPCLVPVDAWPPTEPGKPAAVRITMTAGYQNAASVPESVRHAVLIRTKEFFDNNGESVTGATVSPTVNTIEALVSSHRRLFL